MSVLHRAVLIGRTALLLLPGAVLILLLYQIPVSHTVDIGGYDAMYVRGFHDPQNRAYGTQSYLEGSDGCVRWSRARSFLVFPQAGLPASLTLRMRGWSADTSTEHPVVSVILNGKDVLQRIQVSNTWQEYHIAVTGGLDKPHDVVIELRSPTVVLPDEGREVGVLLDAATYTVERGPSGVIVPYPAQLIYAALVSLLLWWVLALVQGSVAVDQRAAHWHDHWRMAVVRRMRVLYWVCLVVVGGLFLCCYRMQPPLYPAPLFWLLPGIAGVLGSVLIVAHGPAVLHRWPRLVPGAAVAFVAGWCVVLLLAAQDHVTLSVPGVEKDFRVFATRVSSLEKIFHADGFYNLGYPLLLWLVHPLTHGNVFLAARLVAVASAAVVLLATYWLTLLLLVHHTPHSGEDEVARNGATVQRPNKELDIVSDSSWNRDTIARGWAVLAVLVLALNPLVVHYALYVGSDMPFAALVVLALALFVRADTGSEAPHLQGEGFGGRVSGLPMVWLALAGIVAGWAFLIRHPGLVLLPWGVGTLVLRHTLPVSGTDCISRKGAKTQRLDKGSGNVLPRTGRAPRIVRDVLVFAIGFGLGALPQLVVNLVDTGSLLYSQQAKNIWLAVYGGIDWGRWHEVPDSISLAEVILRDPLRFMTNWWRNVLAFLGNGAEDTSEFGRALQLRLLSWPANWFAVLGLVGWGWMSVQHWWARRLHHIRLKTLDSRKGAKTQRPDKDQTVCLPVHPYVVREAGDGRTSADSALWHQAPSLLLFLALYVASVCVGFVLPRFFLPLAPLYAVAATWLLQMVVCRIQHTSQMHRDRYVMNCWRWLLIVGGVLVVLLHGGVHTGIRYVLDHQPADEVAIIEMTLALVQPGNTVVVLVEPDVPIGKYSALAHYVVGLPDAPNAETALAQAARAGVDYLVWDDAVGGPPVPDALVAQVGTAGRYGVYALHAHRE